MGIVTRQSYSPYHAAESTFGPIYTVFRGFLSVCGEKRRIYKSAGRDRGLCRKRVGRGTYMTRRRRGGEKFFALGLKALMGQVVGRGKTRDEPKNERGRC